MSDSAPPRSIDVAYTLHTSGRLEEAERAYRAIIAGDPSGQDGMDARNNLLDVLQVQQRWLHAEAVIEEALRVRPEDPNWRFRLATSKLRRGLLSEAWAHFEARRSVAHRPVRAPPLPFPEWRGEPIDALLVWHEQGFGDVIQFSRYLPLIRARGIRVTLVCKAPLVRLLAPLVDQIVALEGQISMPRQDAWVLIGSLPGLFGTTLDTIPPPALAVAPLAGRGVGIVTRGDPGHANDANRSMPADVTRAFLAIPGAVNLDPAVTGARDFLDTAEIMSRLERIISVDTAQAHLAASIGKPTAILTPFLRPDWRWLMEGADNPWYPSATILRQPSPGDWLSLLDAVHV